MGNYIFTLTPMFTQGLILLVIYFALKYLFFDSKLAHLPEEPPRRGRTVLPAEFLC